MRLSIDLLALRIVGIYLLFGLLWIVFSDSFLSFFTFTPEQLTRYSMYKGAAFILATALLLYLLISKTMRRQMHAERSLKLSEERWKFALEGAGDGVWDWDMQTNEVFRSARWKEIYGYTTDEIGTTAQDGRKLIHPDDLQHAIEDIHAYLEGKTSLFVSEFRLLCKDGSWKWTLSRGMVVNRSADGKPLRMIGTHTDITARKEAEAQIMRLAHFDGITGLPNRVLFIDRFKQELKKAHRNSQSLTLMYLDLDRFKEVNDTLGHDMGDLLLKETAQRLVGCVREVDTVARLGGDEFTLLLNGLDNQAVTDRIAQKVLDRLAQPFHIGSELVYLSTSIGISIYPDDGSGVEVLLKNADQAMYVAKQNGRNRYHYFTPVMQEAAMGRMRLISDLRIARATNQFRVFYQPIVELASGDIYKAEALIRWQHPTHGLVSPAEFIPVAEDTGLIIEIGDWVFTTAINQVAQWKQHHPNFQISINKSPLQFRSSNVS
ncbi:MAG: diguanylate cyclase, partial [Candidatus Methylopumilus sp.]